MKKLGLILLLISASAFAGTKINLQTQVQGVLPLANGGLGNTSGAAVTATALAATPTNCGAGYYAQGIAANGNAVGCTGTVGGTVTNVALSSSTTGVSASCANGSTSAACTVNLSGTIPINISGNANYASSSNTANTANSANTATSATSSTYAYYSNTQAPGNSSTSIATTAFVNPGSYASINGYQILPSGIILQWGTFTPSSSGYSTLTFPIAFPNMLLSITGNVQASTDIGGYSVNFSTSGSHAYNVPCAVIQGGGSYQVFPITWMAIGY
jgi:hypothetical protein